MKKRNCSKIILSLDITIILLGIIVFLLSIVISSIMFFEVYKYLSFFVNLLSVIVIFSGVNTLCNDIFN